jgi:hypothetical protein
MSLESTPTSCKPVDFQQFCESVKALGFFWAVLNERRLATAALREDRKRVS